jgi:hypothetical protein
MKKMGAGLVAVLFLVIIWVAAGPYVTVYQMKNAALNHDGEALSSHVDFPALRESLKDQLNTMMGVNREVKSVKDIPLAAFGSLFGGMLTDKLVELYVTPESIVKLMEGRKPDSDRRPDSGFGSHNDKDESESSPAPPPRPFSNAAMSYDSFGRFTVILHDDDSGKDITFVLGRRGLGWKLTGILLPQ